MHLGMYVCSQGIEPITFSAANVMLYHWDTGTWPLKLLTWVKVHPSSFVLWEQKKVFWRLPVTKQLMVAIYFNGMERNSYLRLMATVN